MVGFIIGLLLGSIFTLLIMSLMVVSKRADRTAEENTPIRQVSYKKYSNQLE